MMVSHKCFVFLTLFGTIATLLPAKIDAACVCNEKGTDYCAGCSERLVVRPKQKYSEGSVDLSPIGDKCWCTKKMIEPAVLPKPLAPSTYDKPASCGCKSSSSYHALPSIFSASSSSYSGYNYLMPQANYVPTVSKDDSLPADPISVSLAIQAGKAIEVPEAKLAYGYVQKPIDSLPKVYISSVKEENLYALKNDVITLKKKVAAAPVKKPDEDEPEVDDYDTQTAGDGNEEDDQPRLTYRQLGYVAEQYKNPTFQEVAPSYVPSNSGNGGEPSVVHGKVSVDCGYKPGRIAPYRRIRQHSDLDSCFEYA